MNRLKNIIFTVRGNKMRRISKITINFPLMIGNEKVLKISEYINSYSWIRTD